MRKVIPKIPKVKGLFKKLPWFDMIYLVVAGLTCLLIFFSNLGLAKFLIIAAIAIAVAVSEIPKDDVSYARIFWLKVKGLTKPSIYISEKAQTEINSHDEKLTLLKKSKQKTFNIWYISNRNSHDEKNNKSSEIFGKGTGKDFLQKRFSREIPSKASREIPSKASREIPSKASRERQSNAHPKPHDEKKQEFGNIADIHSIKEIKDNTIIFSSGVMAQLIEIPDVTFVLKEEVTQDKYQDALGKSFNIIAPFKNATLMKTEREIDFAEFVANLEERKQHIKALKRLTEQEKNARIYTLDEKIKQFKNLEHCCKTPVYHLVIRGGSYEELSALTSEIISDFESAEMTAYVASSKNIAYAIASQYQKKVDLTNTAEGVELAKAVLPGKIESQKNKLIVDGTPISTYAISGLPGSVGNAWLAELCSIADVNVTVNVCASNSRKLIRKIDRAYFTTGSEAEQTSKLSESVSKNSQQSSMESLLEDLEYAQDKLCEIEILISFVNDNIAAEKEINKHIMDLKMKRSVNLYSQLENFGNMLCNSANLPIKRNKLIFTTKLMGMAFPMIFPNLLEQSGDLIGFNNCGAPIVLDYHMRDGKLRVNSNQCVFGKSGGGKSFGLKLQILLRAASGDVVYIIDVESEYTVICEALGGLVIDLSSGEFKINPLQAFSMSENGKNAVTEHILVVEEFFKILFKELNMSQRIIIRELLANLYDNFGITDGIDIRSIEVDKFPIMQDLYNLLDKSIKEEKDLYIREEMIKLRLVLRSMLSGTFAKFWNGHSVLNDSNNFVVFNVQALVASGNLDVVNAQMQLISRYINTHLIENYQKLSHGEEYGKMIVLIDEVHRMLSPGMTVTIDLCAWLAKQCRKYEAGLVVASQSVIDLTATNELMSKTKAVLTESQINILFGCKGTHIPDLVKVYEHANLTKMETDYLIEAKQGMALLMVSDTMRYEVKISANDYEFGLCSRKIDQRIGGGEDNGGDWTRSKNEEQKDNKQQLISVKVEMSKDDDKFATSEAETKKADIKLVTSEAETKKYNDNCATSEVETKKVDIKLATSEAETNVKNPIENEQFCEAIVEMPMKEKNDSNSEQKTNKATNIVKIPKAVAIAKEAEAYVTEFNQKEKEEMQLAKQKKKKKK